MHSDNRSSRLARLGLAAAIGTAALGTTTLPAQAAPTFVLSFLNTTSAPEQAAFTQAAAVWSSVLADNVTVNLTVGTAALGTRILAQAGSTQVDYSYSNTRAALVADATSSNDAIAIANLQAGPNLRLLINGTSNNPNGAGSFTPYLDTTGANTNQVNMTRANAKALGLGSSGLLGTSLADGCNTQACDGYIAFNSTNFSWDLDPSNGITAGLYDFVGIAVHEIGHALGFISGVDVLDTNSTGIRIFADNEFTFVAPLDFYRCSAASAAQSALDWTAGTDTGTRLFSLNGCGSSLASFAIGQVRGDGRQASHWKDNLSLGIMDPTSAPGEQLSITPLDLTAFDVIGWNLTSTPTVSAPTVATPAPASALVFAFGLAGLGFTRRRTLA
ncbi:MAG: NF038122 family metalloprotease [Alphaproteobacteria bacterium]|nr:NF038122 family metalloprotease [Alphaproteobacteria bacterium]